MTQPQLALFDLPEPESNQEPEVKTEKNVDSLKVGMIKAYKILAESTPHMVNVHTNVEYYSTGSRLFGNLKRYKITEFTATIKEPVI